MEIVYVRIFPVYVCSFPTSSVFNRIWATRIFAYFFWFPNHISSVLLLQGTAMTLRKYETRYLMYNSCQITRMAYETWACKFRPYSSGLTLLLPASDAMVIAIATSLEPDQARQDIGSKLDPNYSARAICMLMITLFPFV